MLETFLIGLAVILVFGLIKSSIRSENTIENVDIALIASPLLILYPYLEIKSETVCTISLHIARKPNLSIKMDSISAYLQKLTDFVIHSFSTSKKDKSLIHFAFLLSHNL
jgi:hypothetical protein